MNRRHFLLSLGAGLVAVSTRTIIDLNPQARPVDEFDVRFRPLPFWLTAGLKTRTESELKDMRIAWFDTRTRGEVKDTTIIDNDGPGIWTSQPFVLLRYEQDLWPLPHVEVVIDGATVASFAGDNAHEQAMAFFNDLPSQTVVLRVHAPEHAPLRMPDERMKGFI